MATPYRIYMDDSGNVDHHTTNAIDVRYGSISAVILADDYLQGTFIPSFEALSKKHFGVDADGRTYNIHRRALSAPPKEGPFSVLLDPENRDKWDSDILRVFRKAQYTIVTACVDKAEWYYRFPTWEGDFYEVLVEAVLERCFYFLKNRDGCAEVNIETKNPNKDERVKAAYRKILKGGFRYISAPKVRERFSSVELNILKKSDRRAGAQLVDLLGAPALQHVRHHYTGRHAIESSLIHEIATILAEQKFYREESKGPDGYGRLWRPRR